MVPGGISQSADYTTLRDAYYDLADTHDLPLIDFTAVIGDTAKAQSFGLMQDTLHENERGYGLEATAVARALAL